MNREEDWPTIKVEKTFDWSMSLKTIDSLYGQGLNKTRQHNMRKRYEVESRWPVDTGPYIKVSKEKQIEKIRQQLGWPTEKPQRQIDIIKQWESEPEPNFHEKVKNEFLVSLNLHNATFFKEPELKLKKNNEVFREQLNFHKLLSYNF